MDYQDHRLAYCNFLISSQINYTQTYLADHSELYSHDTMNRFLRLDTLTPKVLWENIREDVVLSENGYVLFDGLRQLILESKQARSYFGIFFF